MTYLEDAERRASYWYELYKESNQRANSAIAEAKKSKERELTAIRMMLKHRKESQEAWALLAKVRALYETAETKSDLDHGIYEILKELDND